LVKVDDWFVYILKVCGLYIKMGVVFLDVIIFCLKRKRLLSYMSSRDNDKAILMKICGEFSFFKKSMFCLINFLTEKIQIKKDHSVLLSKDLY
jgi:hypothetical protein